jgi:hypothetical protein
VATSSPTSQRGNLTGACGSGVIAGLPASGRAVVIRMLLGPPSSATARSAMSLGRALPCQPFSSSISGTPLPLMVLARMTVGWSGHDLARVSASSIAEMSWPSMTRGWAPKASTRRA